MKTIPPCSLDMKSPKFLEYRAALANLIPINTSEKAARYREIWEKSHGKKIVVPIK